VVQDHLRFEVGAPFGLFIQLDETFGVEKTLREFIMMPLIKRTSLQMKAAFISLF